ncbi:hypothetical protein DSBG_0012 [Desulfosporosinus sp. BG]|nr:hypothetical protein DSBG_0012 [Desulfosporosinus sp. BG]
MWAYLILNPGIIPSLLISLFCSGGQLLLGYSLKQALL